MRPLLVILFTATLHASCFEPLPCQLIAPNLTVVIAESLEAREPVDTEQPPFRVKLHTHILGPSPSRQFLVKYINHQPIRPGDLFYIETILAPNQPIYIDSGCQGSVSGRFREPFHTNRIQFYRELAAGRIRDASIFVVTGAPGAAVTLNGPAGTLHQQAGADGHAEWTHLPPGRYEVTASKLDFNPDKEAKTFELYTGACKSTGPTLRSRYQIRGTLRTASGQVARYADLQLFRNGKGVALHITNARGEFRFPALLPGSYRIELQGRSQQDLAASIPVGPDHVVTELDLIVK